jgi:hypothetical protein
MINKVYVRDLIAEVVITWMQWQQARNGSAGFGSVALRRRFETVVAELAGYLGGFPTDVSPSPIWREAFGIANTWRRDRRVTRHSMARLIAAYEKHI